MPQITCSPSNSLILSHPTTFLRAKIPKSPFSEFSDAGLRRYSPCWLDRRTREGKLREDSGIILLWIIFLFGAYSTISWCAGPELEDLFRGYNPLTGKQRRKMLRESRMSSIDRFLKNKCLLVWRSFNLLWKRSKNLLWHIFNLGSSLLWNSTSWKIYYWRLRSWKLYIQRLILKVQIKLEQVSSWKNSQLVV